MINEVNDLFMNTFFSVLGITFVQIFFGPASLESALHFGFMTHIYFKNTRELYLNISIYRNKCKWRSFVFVYKKIPCVVIC